MDERRRVDTLKGQVLLHLYERRGMNRPWEVEAVAKMLGQELSYEFRGIVEEMMEEKLLDFYWLERSDGSQGAGFMLTDKAVQEIVRIIRSS